MESLFLNKLTGENKRFLLVVDQIIYHFSDSNLRGAMPTYWVPKFTNFCWLNYVTMEYKTGATDFSHHFCPVENK